MATKESSHAPHNTTSCLSTAHEHRRQSMEKTEEISLSPRLVVEFQLKIQVTESDFFLIADRKFTLFLKKDSESNKLVVLFVCCEKSQKR